MKTDISSKTISKAFISIIITAIIIFLLNFIIKANPEIFPQIFGKKELPVIGKPSPQKVIAPFKFHIFENENITEKKRQEVKENILPIYFKLQSATFQSQKNVDIFLAEFNKINSQELSDFEKLKQFSKKKFDISLSEFLLLKSEKTQEYIQNDLLKYIKDVSEIGIIQTIPKKDSIIIRDSESRKKISSEELFTKKEVFTNFIEKNSANFDEKNQIDLIETLLNIFLVPNISFDKEGTEQEIQKAQNSITGIIDVVNKDELIVLKGVTITKEIHRKLEVLEQKKNQKNIYENDKNLRKITEPISHFAYLFFVLSFFFILCYFFHPKLLETPSLFRTLLIFTIFLALFTILIQSVFEVSIFLIPFGLPIILLAFLIDIPAAIIFGFVNYFLLTALLNWNFFPAFIISFSGLGAILALTNSKGRRDFYHSTFYIVIIFAGLSLIYWAFSTESHLRILSNFGWGICGAIISLIGSMALLAPIEQRLPIITNIHLLELGDFSVPVLKNLSETASGTYHHSIVVGNLAEAAAKAIGANPFLARVGSYYHDIGKTKNPEFFAENIKADESQHKNLTSRQSAKIIKEHIENGVQLAKENKIPKGIIDIIEQHHGTSQISYFYQQSVKNKEKIDEKEFYYNGPKPKTKEAGIVMIADIVESMTKSLENPIIGEIKKVLKTAIRKLIETEQLSDCEISFSDLKYIEKSMMPILLGIYQKRVEYPN